MNKPRTGTNASHKVTFEFSAGGIVVRGDQLLLVKVKNLKDEIVWTFPKGHIEAKEKSEQTALREVQEETGWRCTVLQSFGKVQYWFKRGSQLTKKSVTWFLMQPQEQVGPHDHEVIETRWASLTEARTLLSYRSDRQLLKKLEKEPLGGGGGVATFGGELEDVAQ